MALPLKCVADGLMLKDDNRRSTSPMEMARRWKMSTPTRYCIGLPCPLHMRVKLGTLKRSNGLKYRAGSARIRGRIPMSKKERNWSIDYVGSKVPHTIDRTEVEPANRFRWRSTVDASRQRTNYKSSTVIMSVVQCRLRTLP